MTLTEALELMRYELESQCLSVELVPSSVGNPDFDKIRVVTSKNPNWYRELLAMYPRSRRKRDERYTDSLVSRKEVFRVLDLLIQSKETKSYLREHLVEFAKDKIEEHRLEEANDSFLL